MRLTTLVLALLGPLSVLGHGNMVWPPTWFDPNGTIGLTPMGFMYPPYEGLEMPIMWFTNWTFIPGEATLEPSLFTIPDFHGDAYTIWDRVHCFLVMEGPGAYDICKAWYPTSPDKNPWMAPGTARVFSPCGVSGGNPFGCGSTNEEDCPGGGHSFGEDARSIDWVDAVTTTWARGEKVEVGWGILANHGGGYSYRLCKVREGGPGEVTEDCFQKMPLRFASENSWVQYGWDEDSRVVFKANRTIKGTYPPGSEWTMNPIPVCNSTGMGWLNPDCPQGFEFEPRGTGLHGTGESVWAPGVPRFRWTLMDELQVPEDLEPGEYVLSFRWDCEGSPQIWNGCSNILIL